MARTEPKTRSKYGMPSDCTTRSLLRVLGSTFLDVTQPGTSSALYGTVLGDQPMKQQSDL